MYKKIFNTVRQTLGAIRAGGTEAETVIMMIIAHESLRGKYRRQKGAKEPALGLTQIERQTFESTRQHGDRFAEYCRRAGYDPAAVEFERLEDDDVFCVVVTRARLAMDTRPLPKTPREMAEFCKTFWNGPGKATADEYFNDWELWRRDAE